MERDDFLAELLRESRRVKTSFPKESRPWLAAICAGKAVGGRKKLSIDTIYELLCCFAIAAAIKNNVDDFRVILGDAGTGFRFPLKPGRKSAFAFFRFQVDNVTYDLCCGTEIPTTSGEPPEAPDISLQQHATAQNDNARECGRVIALWDAKYHDGEATKADVQQMNWWCDIFDLPKYRARDVLSQICPNAFQVSAVITKSPRKSFNRNQLLKRKFSVVFEFTGDHTACTPEPTRAQHQGTT